jgi:hypothetical protein
MFNMYGFGGLSIVWMLVWLGVTVYIIVLAGRLVKAVEKIAEKFESK